MGHESDESDEGDESWSDEVWSHDSCWCVCICCRDDRIETKRCQGCARRFARSRRGSAQKERILQDRRCIEFEIEVEAGYTCSKGCEPFHQRTLCVQSEACIQNSQRSSNEEVQADGQLRWLSVHGSHEEPWWADSPGPADLYFFFRSAG